MDSTEREAHLSAALKAAPSPPREHPVSVPLFLVAVAVWFFSAYKHDLGLELAGKLFSYVQTPGNWVHAAGGAAGQAALERYMALSFGSVALLVLVGVLLALRARRVSLPRLRRELIPWATWAALLFLIWKIYIVFATELVHFGQYAVVGALAAFALGRGRYPVAAFLATCAMGLGDEIWQHFGIANHLQPIHVTMSHWFDFSDLVLDALGAAGGVLPFLTWQRLTRADGGVGLPDTSAAVTPVLIVFGLIALPLACLDPATLSETFGYYNEFPFWGEYANNKPTHWPGPREGAPLVIASLLILSTLLEPKRRQLSQGAIGVLVALAAWAVHPYSREDGMPVHRRVPYAGAAHAAGAPPKLDGVLDDAVWARAPRLGPFRRGADGGPARWNTYARLAWDEAALYVAFEVEDPDVWARDVPRDTQTLPGDEVLEVFLDDGGDEVTYYEFEVSPANRVYDLFCFVPAAPVDHNPNLDFMALPRWSAPDFESAVQVQGTLDLLGASESRTTRAATDSDRGWTLELKIPWAALVAHGGPTPPVGHRNVPPAAGDRWRIGLFRNERPRGEAGEALEPEAVRQRLQIPAALFWRYTKAGGPLTPEATGANQGKILLSKVQSLEEGLAWSPPFHPSYHRPQWFGRLEFLPAPGAPPK